MLNVWNILDFVHIIEIYNTMKYFHLTLEIKKTSFPFSLLCLVVSGKRRHCVPAIRANRQVHAGPLKSTADSLSMRQERSTPGQVKEQSGMLG